MAQAQDSKQVAVPQVGMVAAVRNRRGVINAVRPHAAREPTAQYDATPEPKQGVLF